MFGIVNKLKEGSMKTFSNVANSFQQQISEYQVRLANYSKSSDDSERVEAESRSLLRNNNNFIQHRAQDETDDFTDEQDEPQEFLSEILEILNVDPERRNDREEIRRKLAMGTESDDYYGGEKMTKKPSLSTRLQSGMNLQICFMNETASDNDSQNSDHELDSNVPLERKVKPASNKLLNDIPKNTEKSKMSRSKSSTSISQRPSFFKESLTSVFHSADKYKSQAKKQQTDSNDVDFVTKQAQLQAEARIALTQAKEMAHMQMKLEKQRKKQSPIIEMVGLDIPNFHRRLTRPILSGMNVAQLQVIVNDFHSQIETLNEDLVKFLLDRDDLHMEQDSMLVDIEDLTRYLGDDKQSEDVKKKVREVKGEPLNKKQTKKYYLSRKFKK